MLDPNAFTNTSNSYLEGDITSVFLDWMTKGSPPEGARWKKSKGSLALPRRR